MSFNARCRAAGINGNTAIKRIKHGMSEAEALSTPVGLPSARPKPDSLSGRAVAAGLRPDLVWYRVRKIGMPVDEAVNYKPRQLPGKMGGALIRSLAREHGITPSAVSVRMETKGMTLQDALTIPKQIGPREDPKSLKGRCRAAGVTYKLVHARVRYLGWSVQRALRAPPVYPDPNSISAKSDRANINRSTVYHRINRMGWSVKRALMTPSGVGKIDRKSISSRAARVGLRGATVRYRLSRGWSMRRALSTPVK